MSDDELKKVVRRPPVPPPLPKCHTCVFLEEKLVDNEAGGVKGMVYWCERYRSFHEYMGLPAMPVMRESPACLEYKELTMEGTPTAMEEHLKDPDPLVFDINLPYSVAATASTSIEPYAVIQMSMKLQEVVAKVLASHTGGEYYQMSPDNDPQDPAYQFREMLEQVVSRAVKAAFEEFQEELKELINENLKRIQRENMLRTYDYVQRSITDLKRELLGSGEKPTTLMDILNDGQPPTPEFLQMFGLE